MNSQKYMVSGVSKLFDLSVNGLKIYEKKGIINPEKDDLSNYRYYSYSDILFLMNVKRYRALGYSIKETYDMTNQNNMDSISELLDRRKTEIERSIEVLNEEVNAVDEFQRQLYGVKDRLGKCQIKERPGVYRMEFSKNEIIDMAPNAVEKINRWLQYSPFIFVSNRYDGDDTYGGLMLNERWAKLFDVQKDPDAVYYPPYKSISVVAKADEKTETQAIESLKEYAQAHDLDIGGVFLGDLIVECNIDNKVTEYVNFSTKIH